MVMGARGLIGFGGPAIRARCRCDGFRQRAAAALVLFFWLGMNAAADSVVATVDRNTVGVNESFQLSFEAEGEVETPDFTPLKKDFLIVDQSQSQNLSIVNGRTSRTRLWELTLMATEVGGFTIPVIEFGDIASQPIQIVVKPVSAVKNEEKDIYLDVEVDTQRPFVQQQIVFTARLFRSVDVASASLSELEVEGVDAIVERLGDDKEYQLVRNGRRWRVVERKYVVFPQISGHMTIRPLQFRGQMLIGRSNLGFDLFSRSVGKPVVLRSESVTLQVREPPNAFVGHWLPAKKLVIDESWPQTDEINVGDPVTRKITLQAIGLTASQLPELNAALPEALRAYPEQPLLENASDASGVVGIRVETTAIIPTRPGAVTLPEIRVAWWNVDKQQPELATVPARTFQVSGSTSPAKPLPAAQSINQTDPAQASATEPVDAGAAPTPVHEGVWRWVALGFALVWMVTIGLWLRDRRSRSNPVSDEPAAPEVSRKQALSDVKSACSQKDPPATRDALLRWGAALWPSAAPRNLGDLANRCGGPAAGPIRELELVLYADGRDWDNGLLLEAVSAFKPVEPSHSRVLPGPSLEPMYRV